MVYTGAKRVEIIAKLYSHNESGYRSTDISN